MSPNAATPEQGGWALFLDVDGTILEIAETPQDVCVPESLKQLLNEQCLRLDGALALMSGRTLRDLDDLFNPLRFCASGVHGCERRIAAGCTLRPELDTELFPDAHRQLAALVRDHDGLLLEDKGCGFALHFRRAPHLYALARRTMKAALDRLGPGFMMQLGDCVLELRPAAWSKGNCISAFMQETPFRGRTPVYVGDDATDEDAFAAVNALGGVSIRVGEASATLARHRLCDVREVVRWLTSPLAIPANSTIRRAPAKLF